MLIRISFLNLTTLLLLTAPLAAISMEDPELVKATSSERELSRWQNHLMAPIKSTEDLEKAIRSANSPLHALSPESRERFISSLVFGEQGVASFRTSDLESELTVLEIYRILRLIGFQDAISGFTNARVETEIGQSLVSSGNNTESLGRCGSYPEGKCHSIGTCKLLIGYCCYSPACGQMIP